MAARVQQLEEGLYATPRPAGPHTLAASALGALLVPPYQFGLEKLGGWWILDEPEVHLGRHVLVPNLAGWRRERMPELPTNHIFSVTPDWICEVISPTSWRLDRLKKLPIYLRGDVDYAWIVDPVLQMIEVFHREGDWWKLLGTYGEDPVARVEPFDGIELDLTLILGPLPT